MGDNKAVAPKKNLYKEIFGIVKDANGEGAFWTRIGAAFENRDGSWNLKFNFVPTSLGTTIQMRDPKARNTEHDSDLEEVL